MLRGGGPVVGEHGSGAAHRGLFGQGRDGDRPLQRKALSDAGKRSRAPAPGIKRSGTTGNSPVFCIQEDEAFLFFSVYVPAATDAQNMRRNIL
ncbi:hypothetical protein KL86CLO1_10850 [uncultured Eubacteriales bacterium]|uniref:Uncharacterized protein n=1 Tax=uncultured Eubacteriales bacterium TaxID=172733 RepID=A0A212JC22_9FIRM|nr:hypothetical protein KL86CLO1_10850 [uncultured Eubacteriales bacterium]